ncbi:ash family protein [Rahnella sp. PD12R]|nr:ash family protein [Rahnella sp. PD12R]
MVYDADLRYSRVAAAKSAVGCENPEKLRRYLCISVSGLCSSVTKLNLRCYVSMVAQAGLTSVRPVPQIRYSHPCLGYHPRA